MQLLAPRPTSALRHLLLGVLLATAGTLSVAASPGDPALPIPADPGDTAQGFFDLTFGDFPAELANARAQGKQGVLLMFEMEDCPYCRRMKTKVLNQPAVLSFYRQHFLIFPVDVDGSLEITGFDGKTKSEKDFAVQDQRVRATPVFAFFDLDGRPTARYEGATADAQEFLWLGDYVVQGHYRTMSFPAYRRERQAAAPKTGAPG